MRHLHITEVHQEVFDELVPICRREGVCPYMLAVGDEVYSAGRQGQNEEARKALVEAAKNRIGNLCTGELIDQGCWNSEMCPADPLAAPYMPGGLLAR